jgi:hypothetical protein
VGLGRNNTTHKFVLYSIFDDYLFINKIYSFNLIQCNNPSVQIYKLQYIYIYTFLNYMNKQPAYRDVPKVFGHCNFLLYISYKTTIFQSIIPVNSCSILMKVLPTEARTYVVFCDYFKIFFWKHRF